MFYSSEGQPTLPDDLTSGGRERESCAFVLSRLSSSFRVPSCHSIADGGGAALKATLPRDRPRANLNRPVYREKLRVMSAGMVVDCNVESDRSRQTSISQGEIHYSARGMRKLHRCDTVISNIVERLIVDDTFE